MKKMISDLPGDLVGEILSRVPITSLGEMRSTCKRWNALSKHRIPSKAEATRQFLGFLIMDYNLCSVRYSLQGIKHNGPSIKQIRKFNHIEISKVFHCDGLLLCVTKDKTKLLVWNPYMGQMKWIEPENAYHRLDRYALGYDKNKKCYKVLRFVDSNLHRISVFGYEIYDLKSESWRILDVTPDWDIESYRPGVSFKGNTYFFAKEKIRVEGNAEADEVSEEEVEVDDFLLCFDFTTERFGPRLPVPFHSYLAEDTVSLSCVGEEKLAVLFQSQDTYEMEIWVTTKIEPDTVSWGKVFLAVDMSPPTGFQFLFAGGSFFIDEEKKLAVVFDVDKSDSYKIAYIFGEDNEQFQQVNLGEGVNLEEPPYGCPLVCSYVPSLVQINQGVVLSGKRKEPEVSS